MSTPIRVLLADKDALRNLAYNYSFGCWERWKAGKTNDRNNPDNPFVGGPQTLMASGVAELPGVKGPIALTKLSRVRFNQLAPEAFPIIKRVFGKSIAKSPVGAKKPGSDVLHQEFVDTFAENVANDPKHLANNICAAGAVVDAAVSFLTTPTTTSEELATILENILAGKDTEGAEVIAVASRAAWLGRAGQDGSWKDSSDYVIYTTLSNNTSAIDSYVAEPVLRDFIRDLRSGIGQAAGVAAMNA